MPELSTKSRGMQRALAAAKNIPAEILRELDNETEKAALRIVNEARVEAPRDTGALANSINVYERKPLLRVVGSNLPYAARQEYEHASKRGFFRKAIYKERIKFREAIEAVLKKASDRA